MKERNKKHANGNTKMKERNKKHTKVNTENERKKQETYKRQYGK